MTCELIILERRTGRAWDAAPQVQVVTCTTNRTGSPATMKFTINASPLWRVIRSGTLWTAR